MILRGLNADTMRRSAAEQVIKGRQPLSRLDYRE
jgi:hypothetical protein